MNRWLKQNLNIHVLFILVGAIAGGSAIAAVVGSDVQRLNLEVFGNEPEKSISVKIGKLETKVDNALDLLQKIDNKVRP